MTDIAALSDPFGETVRYLADYLNVISTQDESDRDKVLEYHINRACVAIDSRHPPSAVMESAEPVGRLSIMGEITTADEDGELNHPMSLLIEFDSPEEIRAAIQQGACRFQFG